MRARRAPGSAEITLAEGEACVLPVLGTAEGAQEMRVRTKTLDDTSWLNSATPNFFRLSESAALSSDHDFIVGTPIRLGHSPHRRKVVLNLLIDGMCRPAVRPLFAEYMPRIARFFARGVIFENHFSVSEYTLPSLPSIETGRYPYHTQVFNEKHNHVLLPSIRTLAEGR